MGRSGYSEDDDFDNPFYLLWPSIVQRSIKGKRGQKFLQELAAAMDAMPEKSLIANELVTENGACCTMGVVMKARQIDAGDLDCTDRDMVGKALGIAPALAGKIAYMNDDDFGYEVTRKETPEERWVRMRKWVDEQISAQAKRDEKGET